MPWVFGPGGIGDTVLLQPLLHRLHRRCGQRCTLLARSAVRGGDTNAVQVVHFDRRFAHARA